METVQKVRATHEQSAATSARHGSTRTLTNRLNFAQHVIGLPELMPLTLSKRCLGSVGGVCLVVLFCFVWSPSHMDNLDCVQVHALF